MKGRWTTPALNDIEAIGDYIARDNRTAAARVVAVIFERAEDLSSHPHIGRPGRVPETRELVIAETPYIVVYRVRGGTLEILTVIHGARRWPPEFR